MIFVFSQIRDRRHRRTEPYELPGHQAQEHRGRECGRQRSHAGRHRRDPGGAQVHVAGRQLGRTSGDAHGRRSRRARPTVARQRLQDDTRLNRDARP